jgi:transposase-like protein
MSSEKRKKVVVSMEQKLEALQRLDKGETMHKVAEEYGVGRVTVGDWKKKRSEIEKLCSARASNEGLKERKTMKKCEYEKVSEALFLWFTQQRENGVPITGPLLQEKALFFHKEFNEGDSDFTASIGWIDRWKKRYGVRQLNICGEKLSADSESPFKFREQFKSFMKNEGLSYEQLYNCDETGLNFKMLASKTLASREEKSALGYKRSKGGVTILAGYNASGNHKLKLAFVGKS